MYKEFIEVAKNEVDHLKQKVIILKNEEESLKKRLSEIEIKKKSLLSSKSLENFISLSKGSEAPCPECYIGSGIIIEMKPQSSQSNNDVYKCSNCSTSIEVEI